MRMIFSPLVLSLLLLAIVSLCQEKADLDNGALPDEVRVPDFNDKRVAIIGAEIGGVSAAVFLKKYAFNSGHSLSYTIFEPPSSNIITNIASFRQISVDDAPEESRERHKYSSFSSAGSLGFWDGHGIFRIRPPQKIGPWVRAKLVWEHGWSSALAQWVSYRAKTKYLQFSSTPRQSNDWIDTIMGYTGYMSRLQQLRTQFQPLRFPFRDLHGLHRDLGLEDREYEMKIYDSLTGLDRKLYNKPFSSAIHASALFEARLRDSIPQPEYAARLADNLLSVSRISLRPNTTVNQITRLPSGSLSLKWISDNATEHTDEFDVIILNTLYQTSNIRFIPALAHPPPETGLFDLHMTILVTDKQLSKTFLNMSSSSSIPDIIIPTTSLFSHPSQPSIPDVVSIACSGCHDSESANTYTISSLMGLSNIHIQQLFDVPAATAASSSNTILPPSFRSIRQCVESRHSRSPNMPFPPIELDKNIYYITGIERVSGSPEAAMLMGRNVARLVVDEWDREQGDNVCDFPGELESEIVPRTKEL